MLISETVALGSLKVAFGLWTIALVTFFVLRSKLKARRQRAILDDVAFGEDGNKLVRQTRSALFAVMLFGLCAVGGFVATAYSTRVETVTDALAIERDLMFGSTSVAIDGKVFALDRRDGTWVVNRASRAIRVEAVQYGGAGAYGPARGLGTEDVEIAARGVGWVPKPIDYHGPTDRPPTAVETHHSYIDIRHWLTW